METMHRKKEMKPASREENGEAKARSANNEFDPWHPPCEPRPSKPADLDFDSYLDLVSEWKKRTDAIIATSRATHVFIPDRVPQHVNDTFYNVCQHVLPILRKDSVPRFLRFLKEDGRGVRWGHIITAEAFNHMIVQNALRCAKVALVGQAVELRGHCANPNCMNQYGYFPLHEAAERFSVDMIKLLLNHGAKANLRTAGIEVVEGLLPLHVAVENTCLHKYLEDNLFPTVYHPDYSTKKMFLDTTRLLAEKTDNLLDEIWNYVKDGKVVQTAVLLMAAQKHIRGGSSCNRNGDPKLDGFTTIINRIRHSMNAELEMSQNEEKLKQLQSKFKVMLSSWLLIDIISQAGETIGDYTQDHPEASHAEVLEHVSSILESYGFNPTGQDIDIKNLCPYKFRMPSGEIFDQYGSLVGTNATIPELLAAEKKDVGKKLNRRLKRRYTRLSFFPYWRSVLASQSPVKVFPGHAVSDTKHVPDLGQIGRSRSYSTDKVSSPIPNDISLLGRIAQPGNYQPRRYFGTALAILKVLRKARAKRYFYQGLPCTNV
ncbi:unnamed protein product [Urochloa decumbens]|uniref:Uncharacterized protein n=1 Tax=Urochloa decumbens TaxID=240449 RepID=A0ABC8X699_9POAL